MTIGGGCEAGDASLEDTLRREAVEEAGADIDIVREVLVLTDHLPDGTFTVQHIFLATVLALDPDRRTGAEYTNPARGTYVLVRVPLTSEGLAAIDLRPAELAVYVQESRRDLTATPR